MYTSNMGAIAPVCAREPDAPYKSTPSGIPPLAISPDTRVTKTLAPGQPGTLGWSQLHGAALVCVRYRESADGARRYTTIELVVDERINRRPHQLKLVAVTVNIDDYQTRKKLRAAGGTWNPELQSWIVSRATAKALKLPYRSLPLKPSNQI